MPLGAASSEGSSGESINHFAAIRLRVTGNGHPLNLKVYSLDDLKTKTLVPISLAPKYRIIPTRIVNFSEQRASFELRMSEFGGSFRINRIILFVKEMYTSYPG